MKEACIIRNLQWSSRIINLDGKQKVAYKIAEIVKDGDIIGVGSGSTAYLALLAIAKCVREKGLRIKAIPTSLEMSLFCAQLGIPLTTLNENRLDWLFDGADEVDSENNMIKGRGGAMFKEKLLISVSPVNYILVDGSKRVNRLGESHPIPIEVFPQSLTHVTCQLSKMNALSVAIRPAIGKDGPIISENGNLILDCRFKKISGSLENDIKSITGVIESGLFLNYNINLIVASEI